MPTVKDFYDNHSHQYEEFETAALRESGKFPLLFEIRSRERELLDRAKEKKVFYFATGSGSDISHLAGNLGAKVVTLDFSQEMIRRTEDRLTREGIGYETLEDGETLTAHDLDAFFNSNPTKVLILKADIQGVKLPDQYFDDCFCYCTLPLLGSESIPVLKQLTKTASQGAVSVYDKDKLLILNGYYTEFGFKSKAEGHTITLEGGFEYTHIPTSKMEKALRDVQKNTEIIQVGLGKIYNWKSEK